MTSSVSTSFDFNGALSKSELFLNNAIQPWVAKLDENPSIIRLLTITTPINERTLCLLVLELFQVHPSLFAIPIVNDGNHPVGVVERNSFIDVFIKPYAKELYAKKSISDFMNRNPIVVDKETSID